MSIPTLTPPPTTGRTGPQIVPPGNSLLSNGSPRPQSPRRLFQTKTIYGRFQVLAALTTLLAILALVLCTFALGSTESSMREIVSRLTPNLEAAQRLGQAVEEMDARAADYQLTYRIDVSSPDLIPAVYGPTGLRNSLWNDLEQKQLDVDNALAQMRARVTTPTEAEAVNYISNRFYEYYAQIRLMRYELDLGHKEAALANYKAAQDVLVGSVGNVPLDAQGNSAEKLLKDNNWKDVNFTCALNCANGTANKAVAVSFYPGETYQGITANIEKLAVINRQQLTSNDPTTPLNTGLVILSAGLVTLMALVIGIYYATTTHRVLNPGFVLAFLTALGVSFLLISALNTASNDYRLFTNQYVRGISLTSITQQLTADARADISRLLLSPDSPGLDSTSPSLTSEVKKAFNPANLQAAYTTKVNQIQQELVDLWGLADTTAEVNTLCPAASSGNQRCTNNTFSWNQFQDRVKVIQDRFNKRLLADAIQVNITPKSDPSTNLVSARESYNQFIGALQQLGNLNKASFDLRACSALGESEFSPSCSSGDLGYLNLLQVVVWVAFPLMVLFLAGGIWYASRLF